MKLSENQLVEILRLSLNEGLSHRQISSIVGCSKTAVGDFLRKESYKDFWTKHEEKPIADGSKKTRHDSIRNLEGNSFVIISAQNNTFVHDDFIKTLEVFAEHNDAKIIAGTFHYNKNAYRKGDEIDDNCWFDPKITDYILDEDVMLADDLMWCGSLDILPTAVNPLSGFQSYTRNCSGIFPHAKMQLKSWPTAKFDHAKIHYTTGAVTQLNYIQRKAGQKAEFHHVFGALYVTVDEEGVWFVRQLNAESDTGSFYDLNKYYTKNGVFDSDQVEGVNWGDIHRDKIDEKVAEISWGESEDSILNVLKPKYQFGNDVFDMHRRNHHNIGNHYFRYDMYVNGMDSVENEVKDTADLLALMNKPDWTQVVVVQSNHDLALKRWLSEQDYRKDPSNAEYFLTLQLEMYKSISRGEKDFDIFEFACKNANKDLSDVIFLKEDESFLICGNIECGQHGHNGNNGGRGSVRAFTIQGRKTNMGHTHSAEIIDGVYCAGVSGKLDMGYNVGGSSWSHSHIVTYPNGKRAIITIRNGKWR